MTTALALKEGGLETYIAEINRIPLLSRDEEVELAKRFRDDGDVAAAHQLVTANLRFVVKVAHEYKRYGYKLLDLIQEGNIGLMTAVKKFDPDKGYRLISYAVWWIRSHIQSFVLRNFSLVKLGSGHSKRRLFRRLKGARSKLEQELNGNTRDVDTRAILAERLNVSEADVGEMEMRLAARDFSLDAPMGEEGDTSYVDMLESVDENAERRLEGQEQRALLTGAIEETKGSLNERETYILENRLLSEEPQTLAEVGEFFGVTRERARQIEGKLIGKLRSAMPKAVLAEHASV
ncbi:MAG: RNA polymerase factor sigma-32 [Myxococcota bacterium]